MAVHIRAQVRWPAHTNVPADVATINPCFRNTLAAPGWDADGLAQDLANGIGAWQFDTNDPVEVRLYDIQGAKPVYPMAIAHYMPGNVAADISQPPETAVCLSFYADHPEPRRRGRLYIPSWKMGGKDQLNDYVNPVLQAKAGALAPLLAGLGGVDIQWIVWSHRDNAAHQVTNWWVDDSWDTVRSRGRKARGRITGAITG
jgi:hypothetical protein